MDNSFVLNLGHNEQEITSDGATTKQVGEFIIKGVTQHIIPPAGSGAPENYTIRLRLPVEMFKYAANVLQVSDVEMSSDYDGVADPRHVYLVFTEGEGGIPK
jgi:hypothetical protein